MYEIEMEKGVRSGNAWDVQENSRKDSQFQETVEQRES